MPQTLLNSVISSRLPIPLPATPSVLTGPAAAPVLPGPRPTAAILAEIDSWIGMHPFKTVAHRLVRACRTRQAMPGAQSAVYNLMLQGESGVGKTVAALRYAELLESLGLSNGRMVRSSGMHISEHDEDMVRLCRQAAGGVWLVDDVHSFTEGFSSRRTPGMIFSAVKNASAPPVLILCGEVNEGTFSKAYPDIRWLFARHNRIMLPHLTPSQTVTLLERDATRRGYRIYHRTARRLREELPPGNWYEGRMLLDCAVFEHAARPVAYQSSELDVIDFATALKPPAPPRSGKRSASAALPRDTTAKKEKLDEPDAGFEDDAQAGFGASAAKASSLVAERVTIPATASACKALTKIEALEGLEHVKQAMRDVYAGAFVAEQRRKRGLRVQPPVLHAAFTGNPGTGKTTVARMYGELLCELGLLGTGKVHEVDRSGLVGQYIGQTERRVSALLQQAKGGVIFIDEAHGLVPTTATDDKDFGRLALDLIVKFMEDRRDKIAIVFAGYADPMERLHLANPGLRSRLGLKLSFPDFDAPALVRILNQEVKRREYTLDPAVAKRVCTKLLELGKRDASFANARSVRQVIDDAITVQSQRLSKTLDNKTTLNTMMQLLEEDFFARDDGKPEPYEPWRSMFI